MFRVKNKKTGRTIRCFQKVTKARAFCARLNRLCRCRSFTITRR